MNLPKSIKVKLKIFNDGIKLIEISKNKKREFDFNK